MPDSQKLVLMIQPTRLQGLIWQSVLKSQQLSVIWEAPETDLAENLDQLKAAGLILPDLLLLDMRVPNLNPYAFCRWCREQYPGVKIVLTNSVQAEISLSERQWAVNQGASDLLPGFQRDNLVSGVAVSVKRVLEILDGHPLNNGALISVLLAMKRELESRSPTSPTELKSKHVTATNGKADAAIAGAPSFTPLSPHTTMGELNSQQKPLTSTNGTNGNGGKKVARSEQNGAAPHPVEPALSPDSVDPVADKAANGGQSAQRRRYRGLYY